MCIDIRRLSSKTPHISKYVGEEIM